MIKNFKHKGLQEFFLTGNSAKIKKSHIKKIVFILAKLNTSTCISDMNFPGSGLHPLKGEMKDFWAVSINGNWRIIFRFDTDNVYDVDYIDYIKIGSLCKCTIHLIQAKY